MNPRLNLLAAFLLLLTSSVVFAQWPTTEWIVECTPEALDHLGDSICNDFLTDSPAGMARTQLEGASAWLESSGFRAPNIAREPDGAYIAWIADDQLLGSDAEEWGAYGVYQGDTTILLHSEFWNFSGDPAGYGSQLATQLQRSYTAVHMLFHGVQHSYVSAAMLQSTDHEWIWEGTAELAAMAWFIESTGGGIAPGQLVSDSLHRPRSSDAAMESYYFWGSLGDMLIGPTSYLHEVFQADLQPDRGISGLHEGLLWLLDRGLYEAFPMVIARYGDLPQLYDERDGAYHEDRVDLAGLTFVEASYDGTVRPVAAHAYDIEITSSHTGPVGVTVSLEGNHDDLHLAVDGRLYNDWTRGRDKHNVYEAIVPGSERHALQVRIANISNDPAESARSTP